MNYPNAEDLHQGKFTDGDPIAGIAPSIASADHMNAIYDEIIAVVQAGGLTADNAIFTQASASIQKQIYGQRIFTATGTANDLVLTSATNQVAINAFTNYDQIKVAITATNTDVVTIALDGMDALSVTNVTAANQLFSGALVTFTYLDGAFYIVEQVNPKTGNNVLDIAKLYTDTIDILRPGEYALDGAALSRTDHPIAFAMVSASSNYIDQATKDADLTTYAGYYGDGDGSTTFTLPNLGGEFIRMADNGRGVDADREFGSWQSFSIENITGQFRSSWSGDHAVLDNLSGAFKSGGTGGKGDVSGYSGGGVTDNVAIFDASNVVNTDDETRPRNIAYFGKTRL